MKKNALFAVLGLALIYGCASTREQAYRAASHPPQHPGAAAVRRVKPLPRRGAGRPAEGSEQRLAKRSVSTTWTSTTSRRVPAAAAGARQYSRAPRLEDAR